jgi:3-phenylpropionate/trans-cinnamate dioxygenase ferredoxin component
MPQYVTVANTSELPSGARIVVEHNDQYIAIFNVGGSLYAIKDVCTHDDGPLADGLLEDHMIECPRHGARFDITTGKTLSRIAPRDVRRYEVRIEGEAVQILV